MPAVPTSPGRPTQRRRWTTKRRAPLTRAERKGARSARVRRRRRIVAGVGGALVVLVLAFVLWYELEAHALGPLGPQVVVTVHEGEGI